LRLLASSQAQCSGDPRGPAAEDRNVWQSISLTSNGSIWARKLPKGNSQKSVASIITARMTIPTM
jgi:hypothetical protein